MQTIRRIERAGITVRAAAAQAALKAEITERRERRPIAARIPLEPPRESLVERYGLFVAAVRAVAGELAPLASVVVDRVRDCSVLAELTQSGVRVEAVIVGALESPETSGADVASLLAGRLQRELGGRALRGDR